MKKETTLAIILGIVFGGLMGFFLILKNKDIQVDNNKAIAPTGGLTKTAVKNTINFLPLEITEPNDGYIFDKNTITIKGKVSKNSLIVIQSPIKDLVYKNDKESFQVDFPLALGENVIKIVVYPPDKNFKTQEKTLRIYYLTEYL